MAEVREGCCFELLKVLRCDRLIRLPPIDVAVNTRGVLEVLVVRASASALTGVALEGTVRGELTLSASEGHLDKDCSREVCVNLGGTELNRKGGKCHDCWCLGWI